MILNTSAYSMDTTGKTLVTEKLQNLIDEASLQKGTLIIEKGTYLVSSLFLKSNMNLILEEGAILLATTEEEKYPILPTRVAGIEMDWYVAVLNCINCSNVTISGKGIICGNGPYWWEKYWGKDMLGGMRKEYDKNDLRWACDYDCKRVRNLLISNSNHIHIQDITSFQSGFWNVHILYSNDVIIDKVHILSKELNSPSTDGIDIDSCHNVEVKNCILECNDDSICIKSGRDYDGLRVNKPSYNIHIHDCVIKSGFGITIGSEVSGGIYDISIHDIQYDRTDCGFRIKSSKPRKGFIRNINVYNLNMLNVKYLFHFYLNWNPNYNLCKIPDKYNKDIKPHWLSLTHVVEDSISNTIVDGITISNVVAKYSKDYKGISRAFNIEGFLDVPIKNIKFSNLDISCMEYGILNYVENIYFNECKISCSGSHNLENDSYDNR